jgi:hypothetical protein
MIAARHLYCRRWLGFDAGTDLRHGLTGRPLSAFLVRLAASLGAAISMGLSEALSDDGSLTGRGSPLRRGAITGFATGLGGMLHTFPFLIPNLGVALKLAYAVVVCELLTIAFIRYRFMACQHHRAGHRRRRHRIRDRRRARTYRRRLSLEKTRRGQRKTARRM